jgi:amino acid adenylation domain-containing protein
LNAEQLLSELRTLDIRLFVEGETLRCSAPKGALTSSIEKRITALKLELIDALRSPAAQTTTIPRRSGSEDLPLSLAQERFWFLQAFDPDSTAYNLTATYRIPGPVNGDALQSALRAVIERHEILRTYFPENDGSPSQVIRESFKPELSIRDFAHLGPEAKQAAVDSTIQELSRHKFDLAAEPPLQVVLVRLGEREEIVAVAVHHILCDAWSMGIFFADLRTFYEAFADHRTAHLPQLPVQYGDYALWERDRQTSGVLTPQIHYWKKKLEGAPRFIDLPFDEDRSESAPYEARLTRFQLDAQTSESVKSLGREQAASPFMVLLAIFKALLSKYTRQHDIVVGTPVSTRTQSDLESVIGCFINTHVFRTEIPPKTTARELVARVRATVLESLDNADVPFATLVSKLTTERNLLRSPLFQVAFILQNTPMSSAYTMVSGGSTLDMALYMWESNGIFGGSIEHNANLFHPETMACFAACFETLAAEMAAHPDVAIEQLPIVSNAQAVKWFESDHGPQVSIPDACTHELIERQVRATPHAVAVVCGDESLTYQEMDVRANRLAHRLRALGAGPGTLVALCLDRSVNLIAAPLAVWKAGCAYVPLDPEFPRERLAFMLRDSAAGIVVAESKLLDRLPSSVPHLVCLDRDQEAQEVESAQAPIPPGKPDNLAYVIYTSGSTGQPKGVEITHRSLVNFLTSMRNEPGINQTDRLLAVTSFSFDIAGLELYLPLVEGAQVVIAPHNAAFDGSTLADLLSDAGITIMQATPVTWRLLLESGWRGKPGLKILCGGEAMMPELAEELSATGADVWNLYGPTETTIWSTMQRIRRGGRVSLGRPIANTQVYVLDQFGLSVPPGIVGELYIGGDGLARGYLRRVELTSERFMESSSLHGQRLYRTGDLVRRLPNGEIRYVGRTDHQVKIRGFRIELGEIENALELQPEISQAVVVVRESAATDQLLTAYLTIREDAALNLSELRRALLATLPEYMIPGAFVQVPQFPLTPNGKVDRKALLALEYHPRQMGSLSTSKGGTSTTDRNGLTAEPAFAEPISHVELVMVEIWREVLGLDKISVHDNFFELGGHSLAAARLIARLRSELRMELPLRCIFIDPTIASLSSHIAYDPVVRSYRYTSEIPKWSCLVPAQPLGSRTPLFFVAGYQSADDTLLVLSRLIPQLGRDQPVFGFRPRWIEGGAEYTSVEEMARECLAELRAVQPKGPYLLGGHCLGGIAALEIARLLKAEGEEVRLVFLVDTERPTPSRRAAFKLHYLRLWPKNIAAVLADIFHASGAVRLQKIRRVIRRKIEPDQFYKSKVRYSRMLLNHSPAPYAGRIAVIVNQEQAQYDKDLGWSGFPECDLEIYSAPGSHGTMFTEHVKHVAQVILNCIDEAMAGIRRDVPRKELKVG